MVFDLASFTWDLSLGRLRLEHLRLGMFALDTSLANGCCMSRLGYFVLDIYCESFCLGCFAHVFLRGICPPGISLSIYFAWGFALCTCRLRYFAWDLSPGIFCLGSFAWDLLLGIFRFGIFRSIAFAWDLSLGNFCFGAGLGWLASNLPGKPWRGVWGTLRGALQYPAFKRWVIT